MNTPDCPCAKVVPVLIPIAIGVSMIAYIVKTNDPKYGITSLSTAFVFATGTILLSRMQEKKKYKNTVLVFAIATYLISVLFIVNKYANRESNSLLIRAVPYVGAVIIALFARFDRYVNT